MASYNRGASHEAGQRQCRALVHDPAHGRRHGADDPLGEREEVASEAAHSRSAIARRPTPSTRSTRIAARVPPAGCLETAASMEA